MTKIARRTLGALLALQALPAVGQTRPIRIVVPFPPGGSTDLLARRIAEKMTASMGQTVLVENRPGAGGTTGADMVAKSPPDGTTLLAGVTGSNAIAASLFPNLPYDPVRDFAPVTQLVAAPLILVVAPRFPARDVAGFVAAARAAAANPVTYATPGNGTSMHLTGEMFAQRAGVTLQHVPYRGSAQAMTDLIGGQVQSAFADFLVSLPHIQSGALVPIAVTSRDRAPLLPNVPTMAESGLPGFAATSWQGIFAPAGTPAPIVARLNAEIAAALMDPAIREPFAQQGFVVAPSTPEAFAALVREEVAKWREVVRAGNIRPD